MAAATIGPVEGPQPLGGCTLLYEQLTMPVEDQQRECAMQYAAALVARFFAQVTEPTVGFVDQDQCVRICHNAGAIEAIHVPKLIHNCNPTDASSYNQAG